MTTKNGVKYRTWLVPSSKYRIKAPYTMKAKKITVHNTDNQMPAYNEISYMRNNNNQTSYHIAIDENEAIQGLPFNRNGWHAGDGGNGYGNRHTIGVEIARNYDRSRKTTNLLQPLLGYYTRAEQNAIKVIAAVMYEEGISPEYGNVKFHRDWSGKWCPSKVLNEGREVALKTAIVAEAVRYKASKEGKNITLPKVTASGKSIDELVQETLAGLHGNGDARKKSLGSNYAAVQARINNMSKLAPTPVAPKPAPKSIDTLVQETLAGLHGNGDARKKSLGSNYAAVQARINGGSAPKAKAKSIEELANEVLAGKHGNGDARKKSLGSQYNAVQNYINGMSRPSTPAVKSVQTLASEVLAGKHGNGDARKKSLGSRYDEVQNYINGSANVTATVAPKVNRQATIDRLVQETLAGKHGNGDARKRSLGSYFTEVQNAINGISAKTPLRKTTQQLANEVLAGKHGNGDARKRSLGSRYQEVQNYINRM